MRRVILESPYAGDVKENLRYLRACMRDCLLRGDAPFASHAIYTQLGVLDDRIPEERELGVQAGLLWGDQAEATVVYVDRGISKGMHYGITRARTAGRPVEERELPGWEDADEEKLPLHTVNAMWAGARINMLALELADCPPWKASLLRWKIRLMNVWCAIVDKPTFQEGCAARAMWLHLVRCNKE